MIEFRRTPLAHSLIQLSSAFFARSLDTNITTISTARLQQLDSQLQTDSNHSNNSHSQLQLEQLQQTPSAPHIHSL